MKRVRQGWDEYFMGIAMAVATRGTCDRRRVGCVLVLDRRIIATGYNGSIPGDLHCDDVGHDMKEGHCVRTVHAEVNAVVQAARTGTVTSGCNAYVTTYPCWQCCKILLTAGASAIYYTDAYRSDPRVEEACSRSAVRLTRLAPLEFQWLTG